MKIFIYILFAVIIIITANGVKAQDITFEPHDTFLQDTLGAEIIFDITLKNISADTQTVFIVRTINDLPADWTSSLCFDLCFAFFIDSIVTNGDFGSTPLAPGEERELSVYVFPIVNDGTANVQVQAATINNPNDRITLDFTATTLPSSVEKDGSHLSDYYISQNYPNPFNPSTQITYKVGKGGLVNLKVYNILGIEVATLVNEYKTAGNHQVEFSTTGGSASGGDVYNLPSGVYIYNLSVNNYTKTRKMILEK